MTGAHHYTADKDEADSLAAIGWIAEDIAWYGVTYTAATAQAATSELAAVQL